MVRRRPWRPHLAHLDRRVRVVGQPLLNPMPTNVPAFTLAGSPFAIVSQMPDCIAGATPVGFGSWRRAYLIVERQGGAARGAAYESLCPFRALAVPN